MTNVSIIEFLRARLDEDERIARAAVISAHEGPNAYKPHPELAEWFYDGGEVEYVQTSEMLAHKYPDRYYVTMDGEGLTPSVGDDVAPHIARHDPARVLREVEAKRRIVERAEEAGQEFDRQCATDVRSSAAREATIAWVPIQNAVIDLAAVYADHPDYDPAWSLDTPDTQAGG